MRAPALRILFMFLAIIALACGFATTALAAPTTAPVASDVNGPPPQSIRDSIKPAVKNGGFTMPGYWLWCSSVVKVGDTYHMFASRWPETNQGINAWTSQSECVRATSKDLLGPYTFEEVVMQKRPDNWDNTRVHNVKVVKAGNKFVIFYTDSANECGYAEADAVTGPWTRIDKPVIPAANPAPLVMNDGSMYVICRFGAKEGNKQKDVARAFRAPSYKGPYTRVEGPDNLLSPDVNELEDPTIWWANNQYNIIVNDFGGHGTGITKAGLQYFSKDGVHYAMVSKEPVFEKKTVFDDGSTETFRRRERPFVYANEKGEIMAMFTACMPDSTGGGTPKGSRVVVNPVDHYVPKN